MLNSLLRIFALVRKELLATLKDPRSRFSILIPPMLQCLIFGYAASYDLNDVPYVVFDQDRSEASREMLARLDGTGVFRRAATVYDAAAMKSAINDRRALLAVQINQDFQRRLMAGEQGQIQVIADGRNSNTAATATGYVNVAVATFNANWRAAHGQSAPPALTGTLTMLQTLLLTAMSVAREREQGTFDQLLVTPYRPGEIMAGKAIPSVLIGLTQATTILLVAQFWFRIPFAGSFLTLYAGLGLFLMAAVGVGLLVSSVVGTMQQAMLFSFMIMMPFSLLSGLTTPISSMPEALQYLTLINPLRYAIDIAQRVYLEAATLDRLTGDLWPLVAIAVVTLSAATYMFRHRLA